MSFLLSLRRRLIRGPHKDKRSLWGGKKAKTQSVFSACGKYNTVFCALTMWQSVFLGIKIYCAGCFHKLRISCRNFLQVVIVNGTMNTLKTNGKNKEVNHDF